MQSLSMVSDEASLDFREAVTLAGAAGIRRFELRNLPSGRVPFCAAEELSHVRSICQSEGLTVTALSPGLFKHSVTGAEFRNELTATLPRTLDLATTLGVRKILVFAFGKVGSDSRAECIQAALWLREAAEQVHAAGVTLLLEPEPCCRADTGLHAAEVLAAVDHPAVAMNYDPGNVAWQTGSDPSAEVAAILPFIAHLHVKDLAANSTLSRPAWVRFGEGIVDYARIFADLQHCGYGGEISLEPHIPGMDAGTLASYADSVRNQWNVAATQRAREGHERI